MWSISVIGTIVAKHQHRSISVIGTIVAMLQCCVASGLLWFPAVGRLVGWSVRCSCAIQKNGLGVVRTYLSTSGVGR